MTRQTDYQLAEATAVTLLGEGLRVVTFSVPEADHVGVTVHMDGGADRLFRAEANAIPLVAIRRQFRAAQPGE